jgi:histidinol-phosphate aminotransferase
VDPLRFVRPDFRDLEEYTPVKPLDVLAREIGVPVERIAKLDANENLYGPLPEVRTAAANADFHIYPDPAQTELRECIADCMGVSPDAIVPGAGADDIIDIILRLAGPRAVVTAEPTFGMYSFLARIAGARVVEIPRLAQFEPDLPAIARAVEQGATVVFVASPNNPTGNALQDAEVEALAALDALIVVDEAYAEFSGQSAIPLLGRFPNLIVLRTFSKWAALAGLRVGYGIADPRLAAGMMAIKQPYNVNVAASAAAIAALRHRGRILETVSCLLAERDRMAGLLARFSWLESLPSQANFFLVRVHGRPARDVAAALRRRGVLVRFYRRPELANYIRVSAGRPEDTARLIDALREVEAE